MEGTTTSGAFTGATLAEKLNKLNSSQQSIESIFLKCIRFMIFLVTHLPFVLASFVVTHYLIDRYFTVIYVSIWVQPWPRTALSHWCIFHRKKAREVVETWAKKFQDAPKEQRVPFLYLANDILQNSRRKGPEFVNEFWTVLPRVLRDVVVSGDESVRSPAYRLVWRPS